MLLAGQLSSNCHKYGIILKLLKHLGFPTMVQSKQNIEIQTNGKQFHNLLRNGIVSTENGAFCHIWFVTHSYSQGSLFAQKEAIADCNKNGVLLEK